MFKTYLPIVLAFTNSHKELDRINDEHIKRIVDEYYNKTIHLPRKQKKKRRKQLDKEYSFYKSLEDWNVNFTF